MLKSRKIPIQVALILVFLGTVSSWAEVKLRIYLHDGTLQAGNLVVENPDSFVILNKEERVEIKKDKIMFINGKTLEQWQERPDKLFQTEIIPSDVPDPSYVNDKAPIPSLPPKAAAAKPAATKPAAPPPVIEPVKPLSAVAAPAAASAPPVVTPATGPVPVKKRQAKRSRWKAPVEQAVLPKTPTPPPAPAEKTRPAKTPAPAPMFVSTVDIVPPTRFVRKDFGDYHYRRAVKFLELGDRGRAVQELHLATILDRQNGESERLLGKLYMQEGQNERARKYFSHPLIRKSEEVKTWNDEMTQAEKGAERSRKIWIGAAVLGAFAWLPLLIGWRMLKKPPKRVFTAESVEALQEATDVEKTLEQASPEPAFTAFKPVPKPLVPTPAQEPVLPPAPVAPVARKPGPVVPPLVLSPVEPPMPPPIVPPPVPAPLPVAETPAPPPPKPEGLDVGAVLRLASMVDRAVRKGNALAVEEQFDLARREYRTAMALNPACVEAYLGLGYLCFAQGQWDLALEHYVKALGIDPSSADAHYGIGRVFLEIDRPDEAIYEFQKTLALDPAFDDARETLTALGAAV